MASAKHEIERSFRHRYIFNDGRQPIARTRNVPGRTPSLGCSVDRAASKITDEATSRLLRSLPLRIEIKALRFDDLDPESGQTFEAMD
ncbi:MULTISPECIES: hypothetical protein [unclassified Bradyrhizobium]